MSDIRRKLRLTAALITACCMITGCMGSFGESRLSHMEDTIVDLPNSPSNSETTDDLQTNAGKGNELTVSGYELFYSDNDGSAESPELPEYEITNKWYFNDENGRRAVNIFSDGIVAYFDDGSAYNHPKFDLIPLYEEFPVVADSTVTYYPPGSNRDYDWNDYQHRIAKVEYNLKISRFLEPEIDAIVRHCLHVDGVAPDPQDYPDSGWVPIRWSGEEVLERFIKEHVTIEFLDDSTEITPNPNPEWQVMFGTCVYNTTHTPATCEEHYYRIWLVEFTDQYYYIGDMRTVLEPGCGKVLVPAG